MKIIFDIYSRYKACSDLLRQTEFISGNSILDVGSGPECLLEQFMPEARISYIDPLIPEGSGLRRITGNVFSNALDSQIFDCVSAVDVLEHIPHVDRQAFLERTSSLAKKTIILGFPTLDASDARETDQIMNQQYKDVFGQNYPWLDEHHQHGLPTLSDIVNQLKDLGWHCQTIGHGHTPWLKELLGFIICIWQNHNLKKMVLDISEQFNHILYHSDFRPPHYRQFVVASQNPLQPIRPPEENINSIEVEHTFQRLMQNVRKQYFVQSLRLLEQQDTAASKRDQTIQALVEKVAQKESALANINIHSQTLNKTVNKRDVQINALNKIVRERDDLIYALNKTVDKQETEINSLIKTVEAHKTQLNTLSKTVEECNAQINSLNTTAAKREIQLNTLSKTVEERDAHINTLTAESVRLAEWALGLESQLKNEMNKLDAIIHSKSWQFTLPLRQLGLWAAAINRQRKHLPTSITGLAKAIDQSLSPGFKGKPLYQLLLKICPEKFKGSGKLPFKKVPLSATLDSSAHISLQALMTKLNIPGEAATVLSAMKDTFGEDRYKNIMEDYFTVAQLPELFSNSDVCPLVQASKLTEISTAPRRRRILFITSLFPSPHHGGGNRVLNFIKILSENNDIYLSTFFYPEEDEKFLEIVTPYCCSIQKIPYYEFGGNQAEIHKWLNGIQMDIIHYEWPLSLLNYDRTFGKHHIFTYMEAVSLRLTMDLQSIEPLSKTWLHKFAELITNLRIELADASLLDSRIAVTTKDGDFFKNLLPYQEYTVLNHGLTFDEFVIPDVKPEPNTLVFVGNYAHPPNEDAMLFFFSEIWENIRKEISDTRIYLVGVNPSKEIKSLADDQHVFVTGNVPDVRTYIQKASFCIAPLISGAGLRGKVIEYAALRRTFVATSIATTDLVFKDGIDYLCADTASEFTQKIIFLLKNEKMALQMGNTAYETAWENYDTRQLTDFLYRLYNRLEMR